MTHNGHSSVHKRAIFLVFFEMYSSDGIYVSSYMYPEGHISLPPTSIHFMVLQVAFPCLFLFPSLKIKEFLSMVSWDMFRFNLLVQ